MLLFRMDQQLWNGYMDGLLASYAGLGVLYGIRYLLDGEPLDLTTVLVVSGICAGVKNEGAALAVCILAGTLAGRVLARRGGLTALRDGRIIASDTPDAIRAQTGKDDLEDAFIALAGEQ